MQGRDSMRQKRQSATILALLMTVVFAVNAMAVPSIESVKQQQKETQGNLAKVNGQIEGLENGKAEVTEEIEEMKALVRSCMENAMTLSVPLKVGLETASRWGEMH